MPGRAADARRLTLQPFPDVETSSDAYARRFAGPVGAFFLERQARLMLELLVPPRGTSVLDVGGGHGQLTGALLEAGCAVTVLGSAPACAERLRPWLGAGGARFQVGDPLRAPLPDKSFDVVLAFRLLPHVEAWRALVAELCRLARRAVIVDYPTRRSVNAFADALFAAKKGVEGDTRPFRVFLDRDVGAAFQAAGYSLTARRAEFFAPMALHRALGIAPLSRAIEAVASALGIVSLLGSPVIARAEPHG